MGKRSLGSFIRQNEAQNGHSLVQFCPETQPTPNEHLADVLDLFHPQESPPKKRPDILALTD